MKNVVTKKMKTKMCSLAFKYRWRFLKGMLILLNCKFHLALWMKFMTSINWYNISYFTFHASENIQLEIKSIQKHPPPITQNAFNTFYLKVIWIKVFYFLFAEINLQILFALILLVININVDVFFYFKI